MLQIEYFERGLDGPQVKLGQLGQDAVFRRLKKAGWSVRIAEDRLKSLVDFYAVKPKTQKSDEQRCYIEVKAMKCNPYRNQVIALQLPFEQVQAYEEFMEQKQTPFYLYWVDFYDMKIHYQNLAILLQTMSVRNYDFPRRLSSTSPYILFAVDQFIFFDEITIREREKFDAILDETNFKRENPAEKVRQVLSDKG